METNQRKRKKELGQALVEFALIAPIFLLVTVGTIDLAHVIFTYTQAANSLRDATRYAEVIGITGSGVPNYLDCGSMRDAAQNVFWTDGSPTITINYVSHKDSSVTNCNPDTNNVTINDVETGDMLQIDSQVTIEMFTPVLNAIIPEITYTFQAQRTLFTGLTLGSDDDPDSPTYDGDYDGLVDQWEIDNFGSTEAHTGTDDPDGDGCNVGCEESRDLNPLKKDTDEDGLDDFQEAYLLPTLGNEWDSDFDGLGDKEEYDLRLDGTDLDRLPNDGPAIISSGPLDPTNPDTDGDGLLDGAEVYGPDRTLGPDDLGTGDETDPFNPDTDGDGLTDGFELTPGNPCVTNPNDDDTDGDNLKDKEEIEGTPPTDPCDNDEDKDGLTDDQEVLGTLGYFTDPTDPDSDNDGLNDYEELITYASYNINPLRADTDGDGLSDSDEIFGSPPTDPDNVDTDGDLLYDKDELEYVCASTSGPTDPTNPDTDGDGGNDGWEDYYGTDPCDPTSTLGPGQGDPDSDGDGLFDDWEMSNFGNLDQTGTDDWDSDGCNEQCEQLNGTLPKEVDSDGDGLWDGEEIYTYNTLPMVFDTDGDGLWDGAEINTHGTNPKLADTDGDGLSDGAEINTHGTSATDVDSDGDGLGDGDEINGNNPNGYTSSPLSTDTDGDGLSDDDEVLLRGTDPDDTDTDDDTLSDYDEVFGENDEEYTSDPTLVDTDGDGIDDNDEVFGTNGYVTDPDDADTDDDGLSDFDEVNPDIGVSPYPYGLTATQYEGYMTTDPTNIDTDLDGVSDGDEIANGTLPNNPIAISIADLTVTEPSKGGDLLPINITVSLDVVSPEDTSFDYEIVAGTATNILDYDCTNPTGTITIVAGDTSADITCDVKGDSNGAKDDFTETFLVNLSANVNAFFDNNQATVTITDDDV